MEKQKILDKIYKLEKYIFSNQTTEEVKRLYIEQVNFLKEKLKGDGDNSWLFGDGQGSWKN